MSEKTDQRDAYQTMDLALRVGEMLLSSGAGAADVSAQMSNVAWACGLRGYTADVMFTELAMSHQPRTDEPALLQVRQVRYRGVDYGDLTDVDHLVRDLVEGRIERAEATTRLNRIISSGHGRPRWSVTLGFAGMGAGTAVVLGGTWLVALVAIGAAVGIDLLQRLMARRRLPLFYQQVAGGLLATLIAVGVTATGVPVSPSQVITAAIILLLAGVNFLGAIQDALTGFPLTAGARILEAFLATAGVVAGVSGGLQVSQVVGVDFGQVDPGLYILAPLPMVMLGSAITAASYAFASYVPVRALAPIALVAALASAAFVAFLGRGFGIAWASGVAALVIGLLAFSTAARVRVPALVVVTTGIVPLLPGLSIFRGLTLLGDGGASSPGLLAMVTAVGIAIALSSGVILGEYLAQPLKAEAHKLENKLAGPRLVGPIAVRKRRRKAADDGRSAEPLSRPADAARRRRTPRPGASDPSD